MPSAVVKVGVDVARTARLIQMEGMFDVPPSQRSELEWSVSLPIENTTWNVGLIVGASGSGKSTAARHLFPGLVDREFDWPADRSVVDGFPAAMGVKEILALLSSVGFSSPPAWVRPYRVLSNGERFRCHLARVLAETGDAPAVVDEFSSVVDRTVAQIGSAAVAKTVRRTGRQFVAVTCHHDVEEWLDPDWVLEMPSGTFTRRSLRGHPPIDLEVARVTPDAWPLFQHHHYLDTSLARSARCFCAFWRGRPVAFASAVHSPGRVSYWREHRTVCLPDFQGCGVGNAVSEFVAGVMKALKGVYRSTTGNPAMIRHRARSPLWKMTRSPATRTGADGNRAWAISVGMNKTRATDRLTAGFQFVGPANPEAARGFGLL